MILGLGTDIVRVSRIAHLQQQYNDKFKERLLTPAELSKLSSLKPEDTSKYLAKRFAAKEALVKAIGVGFDGNISLQDISVLNNNLGKPYYDISEKLDKYIMQVFNTAQYRMHLSISDDIEYASAIAIIEK